MSFFPKKRPKKGKKVPKWAKKGQKTPKKGQNEQKIKWVFGRALCQKRIGAGVSKKYPKSFKNLVKKPEKNAKSRPTNSI